MSSTIRNKILREEISLDKTEKDDGEEYESRSAIVARDRPVFRPPIIAPVDYLKVESEVGLVQDSHILRVLPLEGAFESLILSEGVD